MHKKLLGGAWCDLEDDEAQHTQRALHEHCLVVGALWSGDLLLSREWVAHAPRLAPRSDKLCLREQERLAEKYWRQHMDAAELETAAAAQDRAVGKEGNRAVALQRGAALHQLADMHEQSQHL